MTDTDNLRRLRNALVHYKPEWDTELKEHRNLEDRLDGRFPLNPYAHSNYAFFPKKCLGHGCAAWAVETSVAFLEEFFDRMNLPQRLDAYRARLTTTTNS